MKHPRSPQEEAEPPKKKYRGLPAAGQQDHPAQWHIDAPNHVIVTLELCERMILPIGGVPLIPEGQQVMVGSRARTLAIRTNAPLTPEAIGELVKAVVMEVSHGHIDQAKLEEIQGAVVRCR